MITKSIEIDLSVLGRLANSSPDEFLISVSVLPGSCKSVFPVLGCQNLAVAG